MTRGSRIAIGTVLFALATTSVHRMWLVERLRGAGDRTCAEQCHNESDYGHGRVMCENDCEEATRNHTHSQD